MQVGLVRLHTEKVGEDGQSDVVADLFLFHFKKRIKLLLVKVRILVTASHIFVDYLLGLAFS